MTQKKSPQRSIKLPTKFRQNIFLRTLFYDLWFRWILGVFSVLLGLTVLFISKIHVASLPDTDPPLKVSYLDRLQARSLINTARQSADQKDLKGSMTAWLSAAANDPANINVYRGILRTLSEAPKAPSEFIPFGYASSSQLLQRTATNLNDLTLVAHFNSKVSLYQNNIEILTPLGTNHTVETARFLAEAYFEEDQMKSFGQFLETHASKLHSAPELDIILNGWAAAWGPAAGLSNGRKNLAKSRQTTLGAIAAAKVQLKVFFFIDDLEAYREAFEFLLERNQEEMRDHVRLWSLLVQAGRTSEAKNLAQNFSRQPASEKDAVRMCRTLESLNLFQFAADFAEKQRSIFDYSNELWLISSDLYIHLADWAQLRELAVQMRSAPKIAGTMKAYGWFLEGFVDVQQQNDGAADACFAQTVEAGFSNPQLAARTATQLRRLNRPKFALALLQRLEKDFATSSSFWFELSAAAYESKNQELIQSSIEKAYSIDPKNRAIAHNYAAMLIATEKKTDLALKLIFQLIASNPTSIDLRINQCLALINGGRIADADLALRKLDASRLPPNEQSVIHYAWFRIHASRQQKELARRAAAEINRTSLLQPQIDHLERTLKSFGT